MNDSVEDPSVGGHDLLHERQSDALGCAALELAQQLDGVHDPADVLGGDEADQADEAELGVDVDHRPVRGEGERDVGIALTVLVEGRGRSVVVLDGLLDGRVAGELGDELGVRPVGIPPIAGDGEQSFPHRLGGLHRPRRPTSRSVSTRTSSRPIRSDVSAGAITTSSIPNTSRTICWASVTNPWPTSAHAHVTVATPSRSATDAVEKSSYPSENIRFLNPTATAVPRRTSTGSVVSPVPPGSSSAVWAGPGRPGLAGLVLGGLVRGRRRRHG